MMDLVDKVAYDSLKVLASTSDGFLLNKEAWGTMDSYGLGTEARVFGLPDPLLQRPVFPERPVLTTPDLTDNVANISLQDQDELNKRLKDHQSSSSDGP